MVSRRVVLVTAPLGAAAAVYAAVRADLPGRLSADDALPSPTTSRPPPTTAAPTTASATTTATSTTTTATATPTTTATRRPAAPTLTALRRELTALQRRHGVDLAVAASDGRTRRTFTHNPGTTIEAASIAKADLVAVLLLQHQDRGTSITSRQLGLARQAIRVSDHEAAWALFREVGLAAGLEAGNRRLGLRETQCFDYSWGLTRTTAADQLRLIGQLDAAGTRASVLTAASADILLDLMGTVVPEQRWGVSAAARDGDRVCLKNGWLPRSKLGGLWIVNSIGRVTGPTVDLRLAVLSQRWRSQGAGIAAVEEVSALVRRHLLP